MNTIEAILSQYVVYKEGDIFTAKDTSGEYLDVQQLEKLVAGLYMTLKQAKSGVSQAEVSNAGYWAAMRSILKTAQWSFPPETNQFIFTGRYPNPIPESGSCVYFMRHPSQSNSIKIGLSQNLFIRTKNFYWELGQIPVELLAIIKTPHHKLLERMLHNHFSQHHVSGEWFLEAPVLNQLREVTNGRA